MTFADFWGALQRNHAIPSAGLALVIVGATVYWLEPISRFLGRASDPFAASRNRIAERRALGDEAEARRVEERMQDQQERMVRYGRVMMIAGALVVILNVLLNR